MHVGDVDPAAVVALVESALGRRIGSVRLVGRGVDHVAYDVDDALIARIAAVRDETTGASVEREVRLLDLVATVSPVPIPAVVAYEPTAGLLVTTKLRGTSLLDDPCPEPDRLAGPLADLLAALRSIDIDRLPGMVEPDEYTLAARLTDAAASYRRIAGATLSVPHRRTIEQFLARTPPAATDELALCHNDLGAEHLLAAADRLTLTGVIDWSDAALADPAVDLGRLYRDLGPGTTEIIATRLDPDRSTETMARAAFYARCALVEDLDHGLGTGDRRYSDSAIAHLAQTFRETQINR